MKKIISTIVAASMAVIMTTSCGGTASIKKADTEAEAMADFAFDLLRQESKVSDGNILFSPDSIVSAMMLAEIGAKGNTLSEMDEVINRGINKEKYIEFLNGLHEKGNIDKYGRKKDEEDGEDDEDGENRKNKYNVANSVWVSDDPEIHVNENFINEAREKLGAEVFQEPFGEPRSKETVEKINAWVNEKTDGMIPTIINDLEEDSIAALINAVSFSSPWRHSFPSYSVEEEDFKNEDGKKVNVTMFNDTVDFYFPLNGGKGFIKDYENDFCFVGILPPKGKNIDKFIEGLDGKEFVDSFLKPKGDADVLIKVPKFSYDYDTKLSDTLKDMGVKEAFKKWEYGQKDSADFSGMFDEKNHAYIQEVIHKAYIDLDRKGTSAAAATYVSVGGTAEGAIDLKPPKEIKIYLDRPFVYAIVDKETGAPIFIGAVKNLEEE